MSKYAFLFIDDGVDYQGSPTPEQQKVYADIFKWFETNGSKIVNPPTDSFASMNGPSTTVVLPVPLRIVVAVRVGCSSAPPSVIFEPFVSNHLKMSA